MRVGVSVRRRGQTQPPRSEPWPPPLPACLRSYSLGQVLGAGSFGVVREATERRTGRRYACKSIPKTPKNAKPTPR